jgi:probable rRNA maturation factor
MILNRQRAERIPRQELDRFLGEVCRMLDIPVKSVTVCFVTNDEIARWNSIYRGKQGPTDVLSFPSTPHKNRSGKRWSRPARKLTSPGSARTGSEPYLGDIAIAPEVGRRNARRFGRSFHDEVRILILHGILHLMGYDHETDGGQMNRREQRLRRKLGLA